MSESIIQMNLLSMDKVNEKGQLLVRSVKVFHFKEKEETHNGKIILEGYLAMFFKILNVNISVDPEKSTSRN